MQFQRRDTRGRRQQALLPGNPEPKVRGTGPSGLINATSRGHQPCPEPDPWALVVPMITPQRVPRGGPDEEQVSRIMKLSVWAPNLHSPCSEVLW